MKKNLKKRQIIVKIQLILWIILLISGIIGLILDYNSYGGAIQQNSNDYLNTWKDLNSLRNSSIISNDTAVISNTDYSIFYLQENHRITLESDIIGAVCILAIFTSFLFITQKILNLSEINN